MAPGSLIGLGYETARHKFPNDQTLVFKKLKKVRATDSEIKVRLSERDGDVSEFASEVTILMRHLVRRNLCRRAER